MQYVVSSDVHPRVAVDQIRIKKYPLYHFPHYFSIMSVLLGIMSKSFCNAIQMEGHLYKCKT